MNLTWYQSVAFCFWIPMLFKLLQHQTLCFPQFWKNYISNPKRFNPYFYPFLYLQHVFPKRGKRGFLKIQPIFSAAATGRSRSDGSHQQQGGRHHHQGGRHHHKRGSTRSPRRSTPSPRRSIPSSRRSTPLPRRRRRT